MSSILQWFIKKFLVEFLWDKLIAGIDRLLEFIKEYQRRNEIVKDNDNQAAIVEAIADQIKALLKEGKPVPPELYEKLKVESRKLVDRAANG
jgi:hypothetical protein